MSRKRIPVRVLIPALVAIFVVSLYVWRLFGGIDRAPEHTISANGTIEATEIDLGSKVAGRILRLTVDEGDEVREGQIVAVLDGGELESQVEQARGAYDSARARLADLLQGSREEDIRKARANLTQAQSGADGASRSLSIARESYAKSTELRAQLVNAEAAYEAARNAHKQAKARLDLLEAGTRSEQIDQATANVEQARAHSVKAKEDAIRAEKLFKSGAISGQHWDGAVAQRDAAEAAFGAAKARLAELQAGARLEEREQARAAVAQAGAQLDGARLNLEAVKELYRDRLSAKQQVQSAEMQFDSVSSQADAARAQLDLLIAGPTKQTIEAARGQVEQAKGALAAAKKMAEYLVIRAPTSGTVILKNAEIGELVSPGMPIVRIANLDSMWTRVYTPLPNLRVKVGDQADITVDAYPEKKYPGVVTEVAQKPEFTPKNVQTKEERVKLVFGVKVRLDNPRRELKPGMPADATIYIGGRTSGKR